MLIDILLDHNIQSYMRFSRYLADIFNRILWRILLHLACSLLLYSNPAYCVRSYFSSIPVVTTKTMLLCCSFLYIQSIKKYIMLHVPTNTPLKRQLFVLLVIFQLLVHLLSFLSLIKIYLMENIAGEESSCQNSDLFDFKDTNVSCFLVNIAYQIAKFKVCARKNHSLIFAYFAYCAMPPTYPNYPS